MKKIVLVSMLMAFVFGMNAQNTFAPAKQLQSGFGKNAIGLMPADQKYSKDYTKEGWLNSASYLNYLLPSSYVLSEHRHSYVLFPDTCMNYVYCFKSKGSETFDSTKYYAIWRHAMGISFDPYSESFDKMRLTGIFPTPDYPAVVTYPYRIDSVTVVGTYEWGEKDGYNAASPDTLRLFVSYFKTYERVGVNSEWRALHYTSDVNKDTMLFAPMVKFDSNEIKQPKSRSLRPKAANTIIFDYVLTESDTNVYWDSLVDNKTVKYFKYKNYQIALGENGFEVPAGAVVSVIAQFLPGYEYHVGDTMEHANINADNTYNGGITTYHNEFSLLTYDEDGKAFCDPYGYNSAFYDHKNTHYQIWNSKNAGSETGAKLYNSMYQPDNGTLPVMYLLLSSDSSGVDVCDSNKVTIANAASAIESVYPNPANDYVTVSLKNSDRAAIRIYNMMGQVMKTVYTNEEKNVISTKDLSAGMYIISVEQNGKRFNTKFSVR